MVRNAEKRIELNRRKIEKRKKRDLKKMKREKKKVLLVKRNECITKRKERDRLGAGAKGGSHEEFGRSETGHLGKGEG